MIEEGLREFLKDYNKLVILGIGNDIRGDDGLGQYIVNKLDEDIDDDNIEIINAKTVPENFTGKIRSIDPSHILIIDAVIMDEEPGKIRLVNKEEVSSVSISTHSMSLSYLVNYLEIKKPYNILFIGIQPENMDLGELSLTDSCKKSSDEIINILETVLNDN
ncbi:hydrogenase maturation peptidase HycI [Methanobrevibacter sp. 87.7]|uniref:hydrogenase maturation peptidase HycI n=1 Tax=Methanobrevibacter sp. 87.7 TaxID=387957 RepID=UPI000B51056C|nr:hydrogenase maturation peptidase HycI [Methanobrevibacter sp. 87.7]OWT33745.1 hydrogenase maturation peptidase HycI [Methanobrevibacter sp. 87.7]